MAALGPPAAELSRASNGRGSPPPPIDFTLTLSGYCDFDVRADVSGRAGVIFLPGGDVLLTAPALYVTLTNLSDPTKSVTLNITGSARVSTDQNGNLIVMARGRNFLFGPSFGLLLFIGDFNAVLDAKSGDLLDYSGNGQVIDVCELLN